MRNWKIKIIHLSHTDIGYKDIQEKILNNHVEFLSDIIKELESGKPLMEEWKWTIECYYILELFWERSSDQEKQSIKNLIKQGKICVGANYLNFSEVLSQELVKNTSKRVKKFLEHQIGVEPKTFVTNDINGFSQSYAKELSDIGVEAGFFGIHTHHGMYPAFRKQYPFYWKLPNNKKMLIWIGEQYAFGNNLGFVKGPLSDYITKDKQTAGWNEKDQIDLSVRRLNQYLEMLENTGYEFDTVPITILGTGSDNDPANFEIMERVILFRNHPKLKHLDFQMATMDEFCSLIDEEIKTKKIKIPEYSGEWPDWWTDGTGSSPYMCRSFREAQRNYRFIKKVGYKKEYQPIIDQIENSLLQFAEHTFGGEDAIASVHSLYHFSIEKLKWWYSLDAFKNTLRLMSYIQEYKMMKLSDQKIVKFEIENPHNCEVNAHVELNRLLGLAEVDRYLEGYSLDLDLPYKTYTKLIPHHTNPEWSERIITIVITLKPKQKAKFSIKPKKSSTKLNMSSPFDNNGAEGLGLSDTHISFNEPSLPIWKDKVLETNKLKIRIGNGGINSIVDKENNQEILMGDLFRPRYEVDKQEYHRPTLFVQRRWTGRNRKLPRTIINEGVLLNYKCDIHDENITLTLNYKIEGNKFYEVILNLNNYNKDIYAEVNIVKDAEWNSESMFIELPFKGKVLLDKDYIYEGGIDQIPGSNIDFHSIQDGIKFDNVYVACLDNNLIWTGSLEFQNRALAGQGEFKRYKTYAWIMNNLWETNFSPDLSGMHQFRYKICVDSNNSNIKEKLESMTLPVLFKRIKESI